MAELFLEEEERHLWYQLAEQAEKEAMEVLYYLKEAVKEVMYQKEVEL
jgi:hypothetical protein